MDELEIELQREFDNAIIEELLLEIGATAEERTRAIDVYKKTKNPWDVGVFIQILRMRSQSDGDAACG